MKVLFLTGRRFLLKNSRFYTEGAIGADTGVRYLKYFDEVMAAGHVVQEDDLSIEALTDLTDSGITVLHNKDRPGRHKKTLASFYNHALLIKKHIDQADAVIIRAPNLLGNYAARLARKKRLPYAVEVCGCPWDSLINHGSCRGRIVAPFSYLAMKSLVWRAPFATYVTEKFLQERYPNRSGITAAVSNVETSPITKKELEEKCRRLADSNIGKSVPIVLGNIGSLHTKAKGTGDALQSLALLKERGVNFEFRILGQGNSEPYAEIARDLGIENHVRFDGVIPTEQVRTWLSNIDFYIHPSYQEGLPRAVVEAMAAGCPVVASTAGGTGELLNAHHLHKPGDILNLAEKTYNAIAEQQLERMAIRNYLKSKEYSAELLERQRELFWSMYVREIGDLQKQI